MENNIPTPPLPPLNPPLVPKGIPTPPTPSNFKKSKFIEFIAIILLIISVLSSFNSFSFGSSFLTGIPSIIIITASLIVLFSKNRSLYNIAKVILILGLLFPLFLGGFLSLLFSGVHGW